MHNRGAILANEYASLPDEAELQRFLAISQQPLRKSVRVNTLKISVADFLTRTAQYGWRLTPVPWCAEGFWIERDDESPKHFLLQDEAPKAWRDWGTAIPAPR
ncbi:hypothetical protein CRX72_19860 [Pantoea sp. BRM17]|nr:hypothetical protein CRX72_19860 [Pantoea sp. BRM17]